jgi:hypothetical protein
MVFSNINLLNDIELSAISLTYNKKSSGPNTEPWGPPAFVFTKGDLEWFINTHCFLLYPYFM